MFQKIVLTRPISEVQDATMVLGTVVDNRTREVMLILIREFQSPDEEMKKIVLKVRWSIR